MQQYNDTKYGSLEAALSAVGKATFVQFYYDFQDVTIPVDVLAEKLFLESPRAKSRNQRFRIPRARHIFELGLELRALEIIIESKQVDEEAKRRAKEILSREQELRGFVDERESEQTFISSLNGEIVYADAIAFEYDNAPKQPKKVQIQETTKYPRSRTVAMNALRAACYLCEANEQHPLFKRKNSDINYTEPHHLVPLSASNRFPNIDLDREQNVVSLCSSCHNWLHYGANIDEILWPLYEKRRHLLKLVGINVSYEELLSFYQ